MEAKLSLKPFNCLIHQNDTIQRVSLDLNNADPLYCVECIVQNKDTTKASSLLTLQAFLEQACKHYREIGGPTPIEESAPNFLVEFLSEERQVITRLTDHIEAEKAKVDEGIDRALEIVKESLLQKREELKRSLDLQLINLKANYAYYKTKIETLYGSQSKQVPTTMQEMIPKIDALKITEDLETFVKGTRDDMLINNQRTQRDPHQGLKNLSDAITKQSSIFPITPIGDLAQKEELLSNFKEQILAAVEKTFPDVVTRISKLTIQAHNIDSDLIALVNQLEDKSNRQRILTSLLAAAAKSKERLNEVVKAFEQNRTGAKALVNIDSSNSSPDNVNNSALLLSLLLQSQESMRISEFTKLESLKVLTQALSSSQTKVILSALDGLIVLLEFGKKGNTVNGQEYTNLVEELNALDVIENFQCHESAEVYEKAVNILEKYFCVEEEY